MEKYQKIQSVFLRDPETNFKNLLEGQWTTPEFAALRNINWIFTEKIDGTNIRVIWNDGKISFKGRTDNAQIPPHLLKYLKETFTEDLFLNFKDPDNPVCLYGEGYGVKIQKGGNYMKDRVGFILFDITIGPWILKRGDIEEIAHNMGIEIVPIIGKGSLSDAIEMTRVGFKSTIAQNKDYTAEGLIMKPEVELFDRSGKRIITKIKHKDFNYE